METNLNELNYFSDDCGVIVGIAEVPSGIATEEFISDEICDDLSKNYKIQREQYMIKGKRADWKYLYKPLVYRLFGERKVMFYTLFDDFSYPNRFFHPFHGIDNQSTPENHGSDKQLSPYNYQITVGLNVMKDASVDSLCKSFQEGIWEKYSFSCFTRLKVNSNLLTQSGLMLVEKIKERFDEIANVKQQYYKVLYGIGFDEIILINFSNSISDLLTFVCKCRNMMSVESNAHYFTSAHSCPGYLFRACDAQEEHYQFDNKDDGIEFLFSWSLKPGHLNNLNNELASVINKSQHHAKININTLSYELDLSISDYKDEKEKLLDLFSAISDVDWCNNHTYGVRTHILIKSDDNYINDNIAQFSPEAHFSFDNKSYVFSSEEIMELRDALDQIGISKNLKERVMKMYYNYNHKASDYNYYFSFLSLKPFLKNFLKVISDYRNKYQEIKSFELHQWIDESVRDFEHAYHNRFHQSQRTRALTDYNVEWNGGIQQIVLSFDGLFKRYLCLLSKNYVRKFLYISGDDRVHVNEHSYKINMVNVTYPEFFISTMWKEIFNFWILETSKDRSYTTSFFADDHFEKHLNSIKHRLFHHPKYNPNNEIHHFFISELNKEYFVSIFADALAHSYGYCGSTEDFEFWYWANFLQAAIHYDKVDGTVNKNRFILFLSRIMMSRKLSGLPIESILPNPPDPSLSSLWIECFRDTQDVVESLWEVLDYLNVIQIINSYQCVLLDNIQNGSFELIRNDPDSFYSLMKTCQGGIKQNRESYQNIFKERRVPFNYDWQNEDFALSYIPSYLNFVKERFGHIIVLSRSNGKICLDMADEQYYGDMLFDPLGGLFCLSGVHQASFFSAKAILYLSMIDYYYKIEWQNEKKIMNNQ